MDTDYIELPMFDFPSAHEPKPAKTAAQVARELVPSWRAYSGRNHCDPCVKVAHEANLAGQTPSIPRHARHIRAIKATGEETYLCDTHGEPIKADAKAHAKTTQRRR